MTYTAKVSGTYTLRIIEQLSGCFKISSGVVVNVQNTSAVPEINSAQSNLRVQPNPFSNSVSILLSNREGQNFSVKIFDLAGRLVKTIASDVSEGGNFEYNWTADDQNGNPINSGIYFLQLEANNSSQTKKLILVR
jgi:flagellar hook assembly protein FlgD